MRSIFWLSALAFACSLSAQAAQAAQVYKWTDDKGVTHFSAQPPEGQKANEVDVKTAPQINGSGSAPTYKMPNGAQQPSVSNDAQQQELDRQVKAQVREDQAKLKEQCNQARNNLAQLRNNPRILVQSGRGETRRLTEEERQQRLADTQLSIEQNCGK